MPVHAGMYRRYLSRIERRAQINAFDQRGEFVCDRVEPHVHLRGQYNAFGARPSRGLVNVGVGLMAIRQILRRAAGSSLAQWSAPRSRDPIIITATTPTIYPGPYYAAPPGPVYGPPGPSYGPPVAGD